MILMLLEEVLLTIQQVIFRSLVEEKVKKLQKREKILGLSSKMGPRSLRPL